MGWLKIFPIFVLTLQFSTSWAAPTSNPLNPPAANVVQEAKLLVANMMDNPRGPYSRLRWFCADGSIHPPQAYACREHGGGRQHGEYSDQRQRLQELGWPVGTVLAALSWEEFWDLDNSHRRLRDLVLEHYLVETQHGWVLRRAQFYRGRVQLEDEEAAGRQLLLRLLAEDQWLKEHYLLARELVLTLPHGAQPDLSRSIRRSSQDIAEQEPNFEKLRIEIHTRPSEQSAQRVQQWLSTYRQQPSALETIINTTTTLIDELNLLYGAAGRDRRLSRLQQQLNTHPRLKHIATLLRESQSGDQIQRADRLSQILVLIRRQLTEFNPAQRLLLLDGLADIGMELNLTIAALESDARQQLLQQLLWLSGAAFGEGLLSEGEYQSLQTPLNAVLSRETLGVAEYFQLAQQLNLTTNWAIGSVRHSFAEALTRYSAIEPTASTFVDDVLRASSLLSFANITKRLSYDAQQAFAIGKYVEQTPMPSLLVLNPGYARGRLRYVSEQELANDPTFARDDIVILPQTLAELSPVAGVLTLGEGNLLSHVQLLARNFGIPNIAITPAALPLLKSLNGENVLLVASSDGSAALWREAALSEQQRRELLAKEATEKLQVPAVDLNDRALIPLDALNKSLSGQRVGPKAANLGELNRLFPKRVAPALAIPFARFVEEASRQSHTDWQQLDNIYQQHRSGELGDQQLLQALQNLREAVSQITISDALRQDLNQLFDQQFGPDGEVGVFIRSDTNVEDLPGFTGAGLSETIPNLTQREAIFNAIPKVWASVLSPRAITWRSNLLQNPSQVYPSVLLMKSVRAEKSGVLISADLVGRADGITVSTAWGVGGAVAGEAAETVVLLADGSERLSSEAKTPYQRALPLSGGVHWLPAPAGPVLTGAEKQQLRRLVDEVKARLQPSLDSAGKAMPWDIEFGFVGGELTLFQIRPLVERGQVRADRVVKQLLPSQKRQTDAITLNDPLLTVEL